MNPTYWLWVEKGIAIGPVTMAELAILARLPPDVALVAWITRRRQQVAA